MTESTLISALKAFEATEANLDKAQTVWAEISALIPANIEFGANPEYDDRRRSYKAILKALPAIDGWKPTALPGELNEVAQMRFDAMEVSVAGLGRRPLVFASIAPASGQRGAGGRLVNAASDSPRGVDQTPAAATLGFPRSRSRRKTDGALAGLSS